MEFETYFHVLLSHLQMFEDILEDGHPSNGCKHWEALRNEQYEAIDSATDYAMHV